MSFRFAYYTASRLYDYTKKVSVPCVIDDVDNYSTIPYEYIIPILEANSSKFLNPKDTYPSDNSAYKLYVWESEFGSIQPYDGYIADIYMKTAKMPPEYIYMNWNADPSVYAKLIDSSLGDTAVRISGALIYGEEQSSLTFSNSSSQAEFRDADRWVPVLFKNSNSSYSSYYQGGTAYLKNGEWKYISSTTNAVLISRVEVTENEEYPIKSPPINFYRSSPIGDISLNLGDSLELEYTLVYENGTSEIYNDVTYSELSFINGGKQATLENNILTIANTCTASFLSFIVKPNIEGTELFYIEYITINNPLGVYEQGGTSDSNGSVGGDGSFGKNEVSDSVDVPPGSVAGSASATGMFTRYLVNSSYLEIMGDWLWTDNFGLQVAKAVISAIYGNPAESIISLMSYPFDIRTLIGVTTRQQHLYWGNHDSGLNFIALTSQSATIDWGTITLEEYWGNFLDYEPHTKIELYLPWGTGFVSIDPNMCLPGTLKVITNIDFSKGSCVHNIIGNNGVCIGTYAGQCSQQIPILSNDYASKVAGVVVSATALAVAGAAGASATNAGLNAAADYRATHSFPIGDARGMNEYLSSKNAAMLEAEAPHRAAQKTAGKLAAGSSIAAFKRTGIIARNGAFTDGSAALGVQYPYIILSRPSQSVPTEYGSHYGYPSNIYTNLGKLRGYTEVGEIHLDGIAGTDAEISELDSILKGGVIF